MNLQKATQIELAVHPEIHLVHYLRGNYFGYLDHVVEVGGKSTGSLPHKQDGGVSGLLCLLCT